MKIIGQIFVNVDVDPIDTMIKIQEEWLDKLVDVLDKDAYIKDGFWYVDDRYGPDKKREATEEEKTVFESYLTIIKYMRYKAQTL